MSDIYKTPKHELPAVKYWDRHFCKMDLWFDWVLFKGILESRLPDFQDEFEVGKREARELAWDAYCAASMGDDESPLMEPFMNLVQAIRDDEIPVFVAHTTIGADIHHGDSEYEAQKSFITWLNEDKLNPVFGNYALQVNFSVSKLPKKPRRRQR